MPQQDKAHTANPANLQGAVFIPATDAELADAIEKAFDYRGDVTLELRDGARLEGFLANRDPVARAITFFPAGNGAPPVHLDYASVKTVAFTGDDPAFGKSWDDWQAKHESLRRAEAERLRQEAAARGEL